MKIIRNVISMILAFILTILLIATVFTAELRTLTGNTEIYRSIATDPKITERQKETIDAKIAELAGKYGFAPESVTALITADELREYANRCIEWRMGILKGKKADVPVWPYEEIMAAVRADEGFNAFVTKYEQRTVARDKIAVPVADTVEACVLCVRPELIAPAVRILSEKADLKTLDRLLQVLSLICGLTALLTAGLIVLLSPKGRGGERIGYAFGACIPILIFIMIVCRIAGIRETVTESSVLLGMQTAAFMNGIILRIGIASVICIAAWLLLSLKGMNGIAKAFKDHGRK